MELSSCMQALHFLVFQLENQQFWYIMDLWLLIDSLAASQIFCLCGFVFVFPAILPRISTSFCIIILIFLKAFNKLMIVQFFAHFPAAFNQEIHVVWNDNKLYVFIQICLCKNMERPPYWNKMKNTLKAGCKKFVFAQCISPTWVALAITTKYSVRLNSSFLKAKQLK